MSELDALRRFSEKFLPVPFAGCWLWEAATNSDGYGNFWYRKRVQRAHRVSWMMFCGEIPEGMQVCHKCDTPACVNPGHLFIGTRQENTQDMIAKRRNVNLRGAAHGRTRLSEAQAMKIFLDPRPSRKIAREYGLDQPAVWKIKNRRTWKHMHYSATETKGRENDQ